MSGPRFTLPSGLNSTRKTTSTFCALSAPSGGCQHSLTRRRKASISFAESFAALPLARPSEPCALMTSPAEASRFGSRWSSSAAIFFGSNSGCFFGGVDARIYVRGDKRVSYGNMMRVMGRLSSAGFHRVALVTEFEQDAAPK